MAEPSRLLPGDPAPWFDARSSLLPRHPIDLAAGAYVVLSFLANGAAGARTVLSEIEKRAQVFDGVNARWFVVTGDAADEAPGAIPLHIAGVRTYYDFDRSVRALYCADAYPNPVLSFLLSPRLQVLAVVNDGDAVEHASHLFDALAMQVPLERVAQAGGPPPVLIIPGVFEPELCRMLIEGYERHGGEPSGFMRDENGRTVLRFNPSFKIRRDWEITERRLCDLIGARFSRRVVPEVERYYNFRVSHMERHLVSCYDAAEGGHFSPHRDNGAKGTLHRRFACSLNLNADYEGGNLCFPEFGRQLYRPPPGGCVIFSCSMMHQATRVTRGRRYAFLPFLHDAAAEAVRQENAKYLDLQGVPPESH